MIAPIHRNACTMATVHAYSTAGEIRLRQADAPSMRVVAFLSWLTTREPCVVVAFEQGCATGVVPMASLPDGALYLA